LLFLHAGLKNIRMTTRINKLVKSKDNDNLVIIITEGKKLKTSLLSIAELKYIESCLKNKESQIFINQFHRWIIIQVAPAKYKEARLQEELRKSASHLHKFIQSHKLKSVVISHTSDIKTELLAYAEGLALSNYQFLKYFTKPADKVHTLDEIQISSVKVSQKEVEELANIIDAVFHARDLINEPNSFLTATQLAKEIKRLGKEAGFSVEVFEKAKIESLKMGGLLAVNLGSVEPPTFSILEYKPAKPVNSKPLVLVGKGVVYDTGGLSLKPTADSMDYMKADMSGAAAVACTLFALAKNAVRVHVIALVPSTDNRPSGNAYAPGDVIRMYDGTTVEMLNADAEGRMILGDALAYAKKFKPQLGITIATLTGSAARAIGKQGIATMANASRKTVEQLKASGENVYERIAELPFWDEYAEMIKSDIADIQNVGGADAGAITAGKFLEHFTSYPFIHLDIAGSAFIKKSDNYRGKGGTGIGVRLLYDFIHNMEK
jgi:leucyl aminopeptidase